MKIVRQLKDVRETVPCALALGTFDGVHPGHRAVIRAAGEDPSLQAAVFTFRGTPSGSPSVLSQEDKETLLEELGVRRVYSIEFEEVRDRESEEFVRETLFGQCRARRLCCGEDFRFGRNAAGDVTLLRKLCEEAGASLRVLPPVTEGGEKISSTRIRAAVEAGKIPLANRLLGRPFGFAGEVIHGNHLGRELGTPTLNQALPEELVLPRFGVYATWARVDGTLYYGVTNVGVKPTVGSGRALAETFLPEFSGDLYGKKVRLYFLEFIRPERKFDSLEELKEEILKNAAQAREIAAEKALQTENFMVK